MKFTKMHGAGNDFVVIQTTREPKRDWAALAKIMCERHFGIGADGILLVLPSGVADCQMRVFDADGTEAEACGNGIRCVAKFAFDHGLVKSGNREVSVETVAGIRKLKLHSANGKAMKIEVAMGEPKFSAEAIPIKIEPAKLIDIKSMLSYPISVDSTIMRLNFVSMGNPHAVFFQSEAVADFPLLQLGPRVEQLNIFPKRVNFEVARVLNRKNIEVRVWERGVGETLACGSGACAVGVAAQLLGLADSQVDVRLPGGVLQVEWCGKGEVLLSGPAENVFTGDWPDEV